MIVQISNTSGNEDSADQKIILPSQVQVEVLNGCGVAGVADRFTELLRSKGFDVVNKGNYTSFDVDNTLVIDRSNNSEKTVLVAEAIGVEKKRIVKQFNNQYFLDITIIIGKDYNTLSINK
ncbi:MAG: LytR C-terminal domain-containing protein [Ignavibacteriaceae bacterium]